MATVTQKHVEAETDSLRSSIKYDGSVLRVADQEAEISLDKLRAMCSCVLGMVNDEDGRQDASASFENVEIRHEDTMNLNSDENEHYGPHTLKVKVNGMTQIVYSDDFVELLDYVDT